jgi:hypothetical protein
MILILILAILLIAMVSVVAQSFVSLYASAHHLEGIQQEQRLSRIWEDAVMQILVKAGPNGEYLAPLGQDIKDPQGIVIGHGLPGMVTAPKQNGLGHTVRYCALGHEDVLNPEDAGLYSVTLNPSQNYPVETISINGDPYVFRGDGVPGLVRHSHNVVAFIISPTSADSNISCAGIQYDAVKGEYFIEGAGARVVPILAPHVFTP